ncbi:toll/interleukin-1 receptor domain-containing protein [Candidatus Binatia bacterium]|nr:toll/interleukin-1 receptor domain-containing protein [Candidatus Binatia bacterium]
MAGAPADDGDATRVFRGAADEEIDELRRAPIPSATTVLKSVLAAGARGAARLAREVRDRLRPTQVLRMPLPEEPPPPTASAPSTEPTSDEVRLAVAAPRRADQGTTFVARFAAYVEGSRVETLEKLAELGETGDRIVKDVAPSRHARWAIGAPVTVRLTSTSESLAISPATASFEWNGRDSLLSFLVTVKPDAPCSTAQLCFAVFLDTVPIAFLPLGVAIAQGAAEPAPATETVEVAAPKSAFASYASKDASNVAGRLSSLSRWAPGLDIFQDCLDLRANEQFKPQLEREIVHRDVFLLFWSRNARASRWVKWEYETARDRRGLAVILPMPLEDPAIAPPPDEFAQDHWRDRFLLAGYALAKIADDAGTPPTTAP